MENNKKHTVAGTSIENVKLANQQAGLSYNQAKEYIARTTGGKGTGIYSDTDREQVRKQNQQG